MSSSSDQMTLAPVPRELRAAWLIFAIPLGAVFWMPGTARPLWISATALPWLAGLTILLSRRLGPRTAETLGAMLGHISVRLALVSLLSLIAVVARVFSLSAALFVLIWSAAATLLVAAVHSSSAGRNIVLGVTTAAVALAVSLFTAELVLRAPPVAKRLGAPSELAAWNDRYDHLWKRNIFGFRSEYETVARNSTTRRIVALGDSFTWGDKIADTDSTWPSRLERELEQQLRGEDVEVINMAQRGYTTANEAELMRRLGWQFQPDLLIIQFFVNDALPSGGNFTRQGGSWLVPRRNLLPVRFRLGPIASSALLAFLERRVNALLNGPRPYLRFFELYRDNAVGWQQARSALREMADSAAAHHAPVLFVLFPDFIPGSWTAQSYPLRRIHETVAAEAEQAGFHVIDLTNYFAAQGGDWRRWWATPYDSHPGDAAQAAAAQTIAHALLRERLIDVAPTAN